jgi:hypothetical protein
MLRRIALVINVTFATCAIGQTIPFSSDAIAYYSFSGDANNQVGSNYNLVTNGAILTSDRFGKSASAYRFDGLDDYLVSSQTLPDTVEFSFAAWIRPESSHTGAIVYDAQLFTPGEDTIFRVQTGGDLYGIADKGPSTSSFVTALGIVQIGEWQHVAMTVRSDRIALFVNGSMVASTPSGGNNLGAHSNLYIGAENHGFLVERFFHGSIDELIVYDRALTDEEVYTVYSIPEPSTYALLMATLVTAYTVVRKRGVTEPNKAPEPTPGLVTSRAEFGFEMISSGKARLAPSPVVAHL